MPSSCRVSYERAITLFIPPDSFHLSFIDVLLVKIRSALCPSAPSKVIFHGNSAASSFVSLTLNPAMVSLISGNVARRSFLSNFSALISCCPSFTKKRTETGSLSSAHPITVADPSSANVTASTKYKSVPVFLFTDTTLDTELFLPVPSVI